MKTAPENYRARMQRVLIHIDQHLDDDLDLETLSRIAAFSKFHFQRQFTATFGLSVHRYVQLTRMKRASYRLARKDAQSVTDIAMDAGYEAPDAFARAFRQRVGQSPSSFRKTPDWGTWLMALGPLDNARNKFMHIIFDHDDVTIRDVPATPVAVMQHRGDRARLADTFRRFRAWSKANNLSPETNPTFMVFRSEREPAIAADYSMDLCVGTDQPIEANHEQMKAGVIPGGRCAVLRYPGNTNNLEPAALYLYRDWLPISGEAARDFPIYCQRRLSFIPEVSAHEVITELFLPLK
ncbi:AraC family transcriptional regulator [Phyllobacterium myrsinacearum]|uniref:AraC family transcriptional regulator n=1 Tax=Phyllobacterium myrsinacearum TaxID=28101 RepID=A0A2S9JGR3_9HYPH|nr:AraC family transcriptional regulator [Phyllobacterium myrsinacearum]PRD52173.1 AraC family transcriptional regulator [Phyllobacterium myrsinacearum]PWV83781.1 AraC family transcriptional regulator [Phyllobacterium myrsinacearum]RZV04698.1 AraC family transcriptional regulator [Phyllobacterium myrsinacearum]